MSAFPTPSKTLRSPNAGYFTQLFAFLTALVVAIQNIFLVSAFGVSPTVAALETVAAPAAWQAQYVLVNEYAAYFQWVASSATTANGVTVIASATPGNGRWILVGDTLSVTAIGGGASDVARLTTILGVMGQTGGTVFLNPDNGRFVIDGGGLSIPSPVGCTVLGRKGATEFHAPGSNTAWIIGNDCWNNRTAVTTTSANVVPGSTVLPLTALGGLAAGSQLVLYSAVYSAASYTVVANSIALWTASTVMQLGQVRLNGGNAYTVVSVTGDQRTAGAGGPTGTTPNTLIVDNHVTWVFSGVVADAAVIVERPIAKAYAAGAQVSTPGGTGFVNKLTVSGIRFTGTSPYAVEFIGGAVDCAVTDCEFQGTWTDWMANWDYGGLRCRFAENHTGEPTALLGPNSSGGWGFGVEGGESCEFVHCIGAGEVSSGFLINSCFDTHVLSSKWSGAGSGVVFSAESATGLGGLDCSVQNCDFSGNQNTAVAVTDGWTGVRVIDVSGQWCQFGLGIGTSATTNCPSRVTAIGCDFRNSSNVALNIAGGDHHHLRDILADGSTTALACGLTYAQDGLLVDGLVANDCPGGTIYSTAVSINAAVTTTNTTIANSTVLRAVESAMSVAATVTDLTLRGCNFLDAARTVGGGAGLALNNARTRIEACNFGFTSDPGNNSFVVYPGASAYVIFVDCTFVMPKTTVPFLIAIGAQFASSRVVTTNTRMIDGGGASVGGTRYFYLGSAANSYLRGPASDPGPAETPFSFSGGALTNFGSGLVATGAGQVIPAACTAADIPPFFAATASSGTGTSVPTVVMANGSYTVTFAAGDRSTYSWALPLAA